MGVKIDKPFNQEMFLNSYGDIVGDEGVCYGFNLEITRWILKHIAKGEAEDKIDVMQKINSVLLKEGVNNFAKRLALYQVEQSQQASPDLNISYQKNNFFASLPEEMKDKKFIGFSFSCFDKKGQFDDDHTIHIRRIGDSESYEVIDVNFGSRKCKNKNILNNHIEKILHYYNNTNALVERGISVYDIEAIVRNRDLLPDLILETDSPAEESRKEQANKKKKYELEGSILLAIKNKSTSSFIKGLITNAENSSINYQDENGSTPLMHAIRRGNTKIATLLIEKGADLNLRDEDQNDALIYAVSEGDFEITQLLIKNAVNSNYLYGDDQETVLMYAARENHEDIVQLLIDGGSDLNAQDKNGDTALMYAIGRGNTKIATLLIEKGADLNIQDEDQNDALIYAVSEGDFEIAQLLIKNDVNLNCLYGDDQHTVLMYVVRESHEEIMQLLIDVGSDLNVQDKNGYTALMYAIDEGKIESAKLLIEKGADLNIQDQDGSTPLMYAIGRGHTEIATLLIEKNTDLNKRDDNGLTALMHAFEHGRMDIAKLLIEKNADLNFFDNKGRNSLMYAIDRGKVDIVELLINKGASLEIKNKAGHTALDYARLSYNNRFVEFLENLSVISAARRMISGELQNVSLSSPNSPSAGHVFLPKSVCSSKIKSI